MEAVVCSFYLFLLHSVMSLHTFLCFIDLVVIRFYFKKAVIHFSFNWYLLIIITLVSLMFQMCHVQQDWFTENVITSWMTSAMEGLET